MRGNHITKMLEEKSASRLSESDMDYIEAHVLSCPVCLRAYDAARLADSLIRQRASETVEVSPFFKTRVMAAIKEKRLAPEPSLIVKGWQAARILISAMAAMVVVLIGLAIFVYGPEQQTQSMGMMTGQNIFSPEYVMLEEDESADDAPYDLVMATVYGLEDGDGN